jgi:peptide/nickel transport system permease protein
VIAYILRRLVAIIPLLLLISFAVFSLTLLIPGDPAREILGPNAPASEVLQLRHQMGLDQPYLVQYWHWLVNALHGNLGRSIQENTSVSHEIAQRFPVTFSIALGGLAVTILLGVPLGVLAGTRPGSGTDRLVTVTTSTLLAIPDFWLAILLVLFFSVNLKVLPAIGYVPFTQSPLEWASHLLLPWIAVGVGGAATLARQLRGSLADALEQDYVRTAEAKGVRGSVVVLKHALKNASIAPVTILGIIFAYTLGGTVLIEYIFSIPGMGQYFYQALNSKDVPVIQGVTLLVALIFITVNLLVDVLYAYLNPKVRLR